MAHNQRRRLTILSTYWDNNNRNIPAELLHAIEQGSPSNDNFIIAMDSNAHSRAFGSLVQNSRGDTLDDFTTQHNLHILNQGHSPTFHNSRNQSSIIDVTLCSINIAQYLSDWRVDETYFGSDHLPIRYEYTATPVTFQQTRHLHKVNWESFANDLSQKINNINLPNLSSVLEIEIITHQLHIALNETLDIHAPLIETKVKGSSTRWWNAELSALHPRVAGGLRLPQMARPSYQ